MKQQIKWAEIHFREGKADIELTINYFTREYQLTHASNDNNVTFNSDIKDIQIDFDRVKCVQAALKYAQQELNPLKK